MNIFIVNFCFSLSFNSIYNLGKFYCFVNAHNEQRLKVFISSKIDHFSSIYAMKVSKVIQWETMLIIFLD